MRLHERFEWDSAKAKANLAKHKVAFEDAAAALADEFGDRFHLERRDEAHSDEEDRFITLPQILKIGASFVLLPGQNVGMSKDQ